MFQRHSPTRLSICTFTLSSVRPPTEQDTHTVAYLLTIHNCRELLKLSFVEIGYEHM
jgi:hypothetical protein